MPSRSRFEFDIRIPGVCRIAGTVDEDAPSSTRLPTAIVVTEGSEAPVVKARPRSRSGSYPLQLVSGQKRRAS